MLKLEKDRRMAYLVKRIREAHLTKAKDTESGRQIVLIWIKKGWIKLRRAKNGFHVVNEYEVREIIRTIRERKSRARIEKYLNRNPLMKIVEGILSVELKRKSRVKRLVSGGGLGD